MGHKGDIVRVTLVAAGDSTVGKSAMLHVFVHRCFPAECLPTALDQKETLLHWNGETVHLNLWDTPGSSWYDALRPLAYPEADAVLICFALNDRASLVNVEQKWAPEIRERLPNVPIILVGNKQDLRDIDPQPLCEVNPRPDAESFVNTSEGEAMLECIGGSAYVECSALADQGLERVFGAAIEVALKQKTQKKKCCSCCCSIL
ncbi:ras-like GTP-binding protein rhoA [Dermacentor silvarum]|uniref:ras-like GTP-binding protein rhoA n=1 Tax=Dermacentor silvarum TaxID=543639 RepID=UPI0018976D8E|nr:ras-like GTP-binding protein rhoA [Dermacentor silvarum]